MKREGRQHGMVRTHQVMPSLSPWNPKSGGRLINRLDSPPTAGIFTKVSSKPTNHSKFTSRCGRSQCVGCHDHPACKSKDKGKGTHKLKNGSDLRLVSWRVVDCKHGLHYSGLSATGFLDHLDNDGGSYDDDDDDENGLMVDPEIGSGNGNDDDDNASSCDVGHDEDEGWCLVEKM